jgi:hypothetical protein
MKLRTFAVAVSVCISVSRIAAACSSNDNGSDKATDVTTSTTPARGEPARQPTVSSPAAKGKGIQALATDMDFGLGNTYAPGLFRGERSAREGRRSIRTVGGRSRKARPPRQGEWS